MSRLQTHVALFLDLELTCWENEPPPGEVPEIIEIGLVELDITELTVKREGQFYVRPRLSRISPYCTELTNITPELVKQAGRPFPEVMRTIAKNWGIKHKSLMTWGIDWDAIERDCVATNCPNPFPQGAVTNIGQLFHLMAGGSSLRSGLYAAMETAGVKPVGKQHSGLDDARNTAHLFAHYSREFRGQSLVRDPGGPGTF